MPGHKNKKEWENEKMREIYKVEYYDSKQLDWIPFSRHKNESSAIINADVVSKSRKTRARVISGRSIIYEAENGLA
jgi:hypothetical protein